MDTREKLVTSTVPDQIKFWTWVNDKLLGLVGAKGVFQISIDGLTSPNQSVTADKIGEREGVILGATNPVQILNFASEPAGKLFFVSGLSKKTESDGSFSIGGNIQLTSTVKNQSQFLEGYTCCFGVSKVHDEFTESTLFAYAEKNKLTGKITVSEIGQLADPNRKFKIFMDMAYPEGSEADFPVFMTIEDKLGLVFLVTKFGLLFVFEISEGALILRSRISEAQILTGAPMLNSKGVLAVAKTGNIISLEVDEQPFVDFIKNSPHIKNNTSVARKLGLKAGLPGSESFYLESFSRAFLAGQYDEAAKLVAKSPAAILRNRDTIDKFKALPKPESGPHPILKYFFVLMENTKLNEVETREICNMVLQLNKPQMVTKWVDDNKLSLSEELGDQMAVYDVKTAEKIYAAVNSPKLIQMRVQSGQIDSVLSSARPEELIAQIKSMALTNPAAALNLARGAVKSGKVGYQPIAEIFLNCNLINELTSFSLEAMPNTPDNSNWQTKILEMNLKLNASVAETILQTGKWTFYNKPLLAPLFEQKGLYVRALENYSDIKDIKRVLLNNAHMIPPEYIKSYFINGMPAEHIPAVLIDFLKYNRNVKLAIDVAHAVHNKVGIKELVDVFEAVNAWDGVFFFLGPLLEKSRDSKIYHKYIEACVKCGNLAEAEKVIQNCGGSYDPEKVLELLLASKLSDPKCLVVLCDKNNYIKEMTKYLWENGFTMYIEMYVLRVNPANAGEVLGALLDLGVEESYIKTLLNSIGGNCRAEILVREFDNRNKLRLLESWLDKRIGEGNTQKEVHNALAKMVIDFDRSPEKFLEEDRFYDVKEIGKYAESRDPSLAVIAYRRDLGTCDEEIIDLTNKNSLYRIQSKYLVERQNKELWARVLDPTNPHRAAVVEQVVSSSLPESKNAEQVSAAVQAFMAADMPEELMGMLEKIVLHSNDFAGFKKLQTLLITTAMRADKSRVMDYINRLDNYEAAEILKYALNPQFGMYEEALVVLKKTKQPVEAMNVLLNNIGSIPRAADFAEKTNLPEVWSILGRAYLRSEEFGPAVDCFIKAKDPSPVEELIYLNKKVSSFPKILEFFDMARETRKEALIDNEYIYCLARLNRNADIDNFVSAGNAADLSRTGDRLFAEGMYEAARILFFKLKANSKIASCLIRLKQYTQALEYAKKANNTKTWKEIVYACVEEKEFKLAAVAALQVVLIPDHLDEMVQFYELHEVPDEIILVLEQAITNDKAHVGIFTELAALYAKHRQAKLSDFIKAYFQKLNVSKLTRVCKKHQLWPEIVYLHSNYKEYDTAVNVMMEHSPSCFIHDTFVQNLAKVTNSDLYYKAISFYIEEEPLKLNDMLKQLTLKLDFSRVVQIVQRSGFLPLIIDWLKSVQNQNNQSVNDALNKIYLEIHDYEALRASILAYDQIDAIGLAKLIESSDHPEFRRISSLIYRKNKKYDESVELSLNDGHFRDAIETAQESRNPEIVDNLLHYFAAKGLREYFGAMTYTCYELIQPDNVLEYGWRYGLTEFTMPFMIQLVKDLNVRVEHVQKKHEEREKKEEQKQQRDMERPLGMGGIMGGGMGMAPLLNPGVPMLMGSGQTFNGNQPTTSFVGNMNQQPPGFTGTSNFPQFK
jgi:clathrin heavy chain